MKNNVLKYLSGDVWCETTYDDSGVLKYSVEYYPSGVKRREFFYNNGEFHSVWGSPSIVKYDESGGVVEEMFFIRNQYVGDREYFEGEYEEIFGKDTEVDCE